MHQSFLIAINPAPKRWCFGRRLKRLTLGHLFFLRELGSKVLPPNKPESVGDYLLAVLVCSMSHTAARLYFRLCCWWPVVGWRMGRKFKRLELEEEVAAFWAYMNEQHASPPTKTIDADSRTLVGSPYEWRLYSCLRSDYRMSHKEAMRTPVSTAACLWSVKAEHDGKIELATASGSVESIIKDLWRNRRMREGVQN